MQITKGALEAEIANAAVKFQREQMGRGAGQVRAFILGDMAIIRSSEIFTPIEKRLAATQDGLKLIQSSRRELSSINHTEIEGIIADIVQIKVIFSYYDVDVERAEQIEIFIFEKDVEKKMLRGDIDNFSGLR